MRHFFISNLAAKIAHKRQEKYSVVKCWLRTKLSVMLVKSVFMCVRGSRTPWQPKETEEV